MGSDLISGSSASPGQERFGKSSALEREPSQKPVISFWEFPARKNRGWKKIRTPAKDTEGPPLPEYFFQ
jgi:hypothetical protein